MSKEIHENVSTVFIYGKLSSILMRLIKLINNSLFKGRIVGLHVDR